MDRVPNSLGWVALVGAAFLSPTRASATPAPLDDAALDAPRPSPPRDLHFRYYLEPSAGDMRTLVLRDDADLEITIGEVERDWACDSQVRPYGGGRDDRGLQVACGGSALFASLDVWEERDGGASLALRTSKGSRYEIPFGHGAKAWLDPQLVDPAADTCDDAGTARDVAVTVDERRAAPDEWPREHVRVRTSGFPVDDVIDAFDGERCSTTTNAERTAMWATCEYVDEPHADIVELRVVENALLWTTIDKSICTGGATIHGGWRLPCSASLRWPSNAVVPEDAWSVHAPSEPDKYVRRYDPIEPTW